MSATVVFITDFGVGGGGAMAGVVKSVDASLGVYDFDHQVEPYNIRQAAYQLSTVVPYWPAGTVFVVVVDPDVGTRRRSCVARLTGGSFVVTPDNGTLTMVRSQIEEVRQIDEGKNRLPGSEDVHIFHGRDIFSYTAARLAAGIIAFEEVGPAYATAEVKSINLTNKQPLVGTGWAEGGIYSFDIPYGSARVNVRNRDFQQVAGFAYGDCFHVRVTDGERLVYVGNGCYGRTFGDVERYGSNVVGDIQPGESQMLRFNTKGGFLQTYAPEVIDDLSRALDYVVRFERLA